jgi:hypothetical protein
MEKHFFTKKEELFFAELKAKNKSKLKLMLLLIIISIFLLFFSPIGFFIFTLFLFLLPVIFHFYIIGFSLWIGIIMLLFHHLFYKFFLKAKYQKEMLPEFFVIKEAVKILISRLFLNQ